MNNIDLNKTYGFLLDNILKILQPLNLKIQNNYIDNHGQVFFYCPLCNFKNPRFSLNVITLKWRCWVCGKQGTGLQSLYKKNKKSIDANSLQLLKQYKRKIKKYFNIIIQQKDYVLQEVLFQLPKQFIPLNSEKLISMQTRKALSFLFSRGITLKNIKQYNIGYCQKGQYRNRIIIPSYSQHGLLNYFVARTYTQIKKYKYLNPKLSADVIIFQNRINWDLPIILCQGIFDAITIKYNAIPLLGSQIRTGLLKQIIKRKPEKIYLLLDNDAQHKAKKIIQKLNNYNIRNISNIIIQDINQDANSIGRDKVWDYINKYQDNIKSQYQLYIDKLNYNLTIKTSNIGYSEKRQQTDQDFLDKIKKNLS